MRLLLLSLFMLLALAAFPAPPEISYIHPDYPVAELYKRTEMNVPCVITGENLGGEGFELWCWTPPFNEKRLLGVVKEPEERDYPTPDEILNDEHNPEPGKVFFKVPVIDAEAQVAVARLQGCVVWARNKDGWSRPYRFGTARPFWVSQSQVHAGDLLYLYGYGLRRIGENAKPPEPGYFALKNEKKLITWQVDGALNNMPRAQRVEDPRLVYFRLPTADPGHYTLLYNSGRGGEFGWAKATEIDILPPALPVNTIFNVRDDGAKGDGLADDTAAIAVAVKKAADAGGGVVYFPPGTYAVTGIAVPKGVRLRGAGRENTILRGNKRDEKSGREGIFSINLTDHTGVSSLSLYGCAINVESRRGKSTIMEPQLDLPPVEDVEIISCRLRPLEEDPRTRDVRDFKFGGNAILGQNARYVRINDNEIEGTIYFLWIDHLEMIGNTWSRVGMDICSYQLRCTNSLIDSNVFREGAGRIVLYPSTRTYLRLNRCEGTPPGTWAGAPEQYLIHGWEHALRIEPATGGTETTLVDTNAKWEPGSRVRSVLMIVGGTGFGQYRFVTSNTADTLTIDTPWRVPPDATSTYVLDWMHVENSLFANTNDSAMIDPLFFTINCAIDAHRMCNTGGLQLFAFDYSFRDAKGDRKKFWPTEPPVALSWYNTVTNSWFDGTFLQFFVEARPDNYYWRVPVSFGTLVAGNRFTAPQHARSPNVPAFLDNPNAAINLGYSGQNRPAISHTVISGNTFVDAPVGVQIGPICRKTFILGNGFQLVTTPLRDQGARTFFIGNAPHPDIRGEKEFTQPALTPKQVEGQENPKPPLPTNPEKDDVDEPEPAK